MTSTLLKSLVQALREELMEEGEFLARIDDLHRSEPLAMPARTRALQEQQRVVRRCHSKRKALQQQLARALSLPEQVSCAQLARRLSAEYGALVGALVEETDDLTRRLEAHMDCPRNHQASATVSQIRTRKAHYPGERARMKANSGQPQRGSGALAA